MDAPWRIELLGWLRATRGEQVVSRFRSQRAATLLGYLAYYRHRSHARDELIELLWPEIAPEAGRRNLRVELTALRHEFEPHGVPAGTAFLADRQAVQLNPACATDVAEFEVALQAAGQAPTAEAARLRVQAVELYRGPLLPGVYEAWIVPERLRQEDLYLQTLLWLINHFEQAGDRERAIQFAYQAVNADPLREETHHELIRLHVDAGRRQAALRQFRELERLLLDEMGVTPAPTTRALVESLRSRARRPDVSKQEESLTTETRRHVEPRTDQDQKEVLASPASFSVSYSVSRVPARSVGDLRGEPSLTGMEPAGGAVPLDSPFYVVRPTDGEFATAIARRDSVVLVKGSRQVGKTSLLARGLHQAREARAWVVVTDFQMFNATHLESAEILLPELAQSLADQLDLEVTPADSWSPRRGPNQNLQRYLLQQALGGPGGPPVAHRWPPLVWVLDQVDRLFHYPIASDLFGLFRSWHNERAFDARGPWSSLTLVIAYATEAHLFITDEDRSPFNVGTRLALDDFTADQVAELNGRYGSPLRDETDLDRYCGLVGGHPYLVSRGLHEMATRGIGIRAFEERAGSDAWIYGDHLRRLRALVARDPQLLEAACRVFAGRPCPTLESFYRLRTAGVVVGDSERDARPRCGLYVASLEQQLRP